MPSATASLPRRIRGLLIAAIWASVVVGTWQAVAYLGAIGAGQATAEAQRFAAAVWMVHLIAWCLLACGELRRGRAHDNSLLLGADLVR